MTMNPTATKDDEPDFSEPEPVARHRRDFEAWLASAFPSLTPRRIEFGPHAGYYDSNFVNIAWRAWLEAAFRANQQTTELGTKYHELIMAVGNKYDGETRHQTALRYIRQAEEPRGPAQEAKAP